MSLSTKDFEEYASIAARLADDKHGENIVLLNLSKTSVGLCDFVLIVSATSETQLYTICEEIKDQLKNYNLFVMHREGGRDARWAVLDYGGFMVHVLHQEMRALYTIDRLWEDAKTVSWQVGSAAKKETKKAAPKKTTTKKIAEKKTVAKKKSAKVGSKKK